MIKQTITYENFDDEIVTEDFFFNFTLLEIIEQIEVYGLIERMEKLQKTDDGPGAYKIFKALVLDAYGERTPEGGFLKTPEVRQKFESSAAISDMIINFLQNQELGVTFISGLLPEGKLEAAVQRANTLKSAQAGTHPPVAPTPIRTPASAQVAPVAPDVTAAAENRVQPVPQTGQVAEMTTAEKRQYSTEELNALSTQPAGVIPDYIAENREPTRAELTAMSPAELQEAFARKNQQ